MKKLKTRRVSWTRFHIDPILCDCCNRKAIFKHPEGGLRCGKCPKPRAESARIAKALKGCK